MITATDTYKNMMENEIKKRLEQDKGLTLEQIQFVHTYIDPRYEDQCCGNCRFNIRNYFGLVK